MTTKKVHVDGLDVEYSDTGSGLTVLFVHGVYVPAPSGTAPWPNSGTGFGALPRRGRSVRTARRPAAPEAVRF